MTVCVAAKVSDALVFAADRASSMMGTDAAGNTTIANVYNHGQKVFNLFKGLPIAGMTCGMGNIMGSSIAVLAKDFRGMIMSSDQNWHVDPENYTIKDVAEKCYKYFHDEQYALDPNKPTGDHTFEFFIGGIQTGSRSSEVWKFAIVNGTGAPPTLMADEAAVGLIWSGQPEAINRLVMGFGSGIQPGLEDYGLDATERAKAIAAVQARTQAPILTSAMPVQDAIDLSRFLVDTTIAYTKFLPGANTVGGGVDIATITRHEGFKWVARRHYYPPELNPLETDHVGHR